MKVGKFILVPRKGRNASIALRRELGNNSELAEYIIELLNGRGKQAAKTGRNLDEVREEAKRVKFLSMEDTGRVYRRPVFTQLRQGEKVLKGYRLAEDPFKCECAKIYASYDVLLEKILENYEGGEISGGFEKEIERRAKRKGYILKEGLGDEVKWGLMASEIQDSYKTVLLPEEFENLSLELLRTSSIDSEAAAVKTFREYAENRGLRGKEEEEIISGSPSSVAGIYMYVTGSTAEKYGLKIVNFEGATSGLGVFGREVDGYG